MHAAARPDPARLRVGDAEPRRGRRSAAWIALLAYLVAFAVAGRSWWTAADHATSAGNHPSDARLAVWILAWVYRALTSDPARLFDAPIYFPAPAQLTGSEHFLSSQIAFAPAHAVTGNPLLAANLVALLSYPLAALAMDRLLVALGVSRLAAWTAGLAFALGPLRVPGSLQVVQLLNLYLPWIALVLLRLRERPTPGRATGLAVVLGLAAFSSYYVAAMVVVVALAWTLFEALRRRPGVLRFLALAASAGAVAALLLGAFSRPYFERAAPAVVDRARFEADAGGAPAGATAAEPAKPAPAPIDWQAIWPLLWPADDRLSPILAILGIAGLAVGGVRRVAAAGIVFVVLGAGAMLGLVAAGGMSPGVAAVLGFFRHAYRSQVLTGFGAALLAAAALETLRRAAGARAGAVAALAVAALVLAGRGRALVTPALDPVALAAAERATYAEIGRIAHEQGPGPILELPVQSATGEDLRLRAMLGSLEHGLPLVNGFSGHLPPHFLAVSSRTANLPHPGAAADLVRFAHLRWIVLRPASDWKQPQDRERQRTGLLAIPGTTATDVDGFTLVRLALPHDRETWFDAVASGRGFSDLPQEDRRHLEPWALPRPSPSPAPPPAG
jgi:hypothetical protein